MKTYNIYKKFVILAFVFLSISVTAIGQNSLEKAKKAKSNFEYSKAIALYLDYFISNTPDAEGARDLAYCYNMNGDTKNAEEWLRKVIALGNYTAQDKLNYANLLRSNGSYSEAIQQYQEYLVMDRTQSEKIKKFIASCKLGLQMINDSASYLVQNLNGINTPNSEFGIIFTPDAFIFASDMAIKDKKYTENDICSWTGTPYLQMYLLPDSITDFSLAKPEPLKELNTKYHNGQGVYDPINKTIYFTRTRSRKVPKIGINNDPTSWFEQGSAVENINRLEIYTAKYSDGKWGNVEKFEYNNPRYSVGHPALSPDGNILYFSSDMPGGYGGADIYYCERNAIGTWSIPTNAGKTINTAGKEVFPFVKNNGVLYFSSDGHTGIGGLDIFYATGSKSSWSTPVNIGVPVNSSKDDFSICFKNTTDKGYFASNRDGSIGMDDIYSLLPISSKIIILAGKAYKMMRDSSLVGLSNTEITIKDLDEDEDINLKTDENGSFYSITTPNKSLKIALNKKGYYPKSKTVVIKAGGSDTIYIELITEKIDTMILSGTTKEMFADNSLGILKNAKVKIECLDDEDANDFDLMESDENGKFYSFINVNNRYLLTVMKEGYFTQSKRITTKRVSGDTVYVEMITDMIANSNFATTKTSQYVGIHDTIGAEMGTSRIVIDQPIIVNDIYYDYDRWDIRPDAAKVLDKVVDLMLKNPEIKLELSSHTDCRGTTLYNDYLSQKRAYSAVDYIVSNGISKMRIVAKGYGEHMLVNKCSDNVYCTEAEHQMNRRTEIKVTGMLKK